MLMPRFCLIAATLCLGQHAALAQAPGGAGVPVSVGKPSRRDVPVLMQGLGLAAASKSVLLRPRVDGTLDKVLFTEGDEVKAGTVLAVIDPRPYQAVLDQALAKKATDEATLANNRLALDRSSQLARNQFAPQSTVDSNTAAVSQLVATVKGDDATIAAARLNLEFTQIIAPFDGRVGLRLTDPGNFIRAADNTSLGIVMLSQIHPISVTFTLPQDSLGTITAAMAKGRPAVYASTGDDKMKLGEGEVLTIDNAVDTTTGTIKVKAIFANEDNRLWPGLFVNARVLVETRRGALTVPSAAVQRGPNGLYVYTVKPDQTVQISPVEVLQDTGTIAVIGKGIADDATLVLTGHSRLSPGARVIATAAAAS
jgi:multidrug efflux system membrane fusion protein